MRDQCQTSTVFEGKLQVLTASSYGKPATKLSLCTTRRSSVFESPRPVPLGHRDDEIEKPLILAKQSKVDVNSCPSKCLHPAAWALGSGDVQVSAHCTAQQSPSLSPLSGLPYIQ